MNWSDALVCQIADQVYERVKSHLSTNDRIFPPKLTFDEREAAEILGIPRHVLKGCRERNEIKPAKVGKKWAYTRESLIEFANRESA